MQFNLKTVLLKFQTKLDFFAFFKLNFKLKFNLWRQWRARGKNSVKYF